MNKREIQKKNCKKVNRRGISDALQQMIGFKLGTWGADARELVSSMGLTKLEWENIKQVEDNGNLDEDDVKEIDEYFKND